MNVGVIGNGFVGNSIYHTFSPGVLVRVHDKNPERSTHSLVEVVDESDIIFVCVPTPMRGDGQIDVSIIDAVFVDILRAMDEIGMDQDERDDKLFVIKSTVVPGTTDNLAEVTELNIAFSPEFLTERTAVSDSICSNHVIVGSSNTDSSEKLVTLYTKRFGAAYKVFITTNRTAEFIKYMRNTFFATKVTFMNEMYRMAVNGHIDWEDAVSGFAMDGRIGHSHLGVPGHDGHYGYGGTCFPKDISAIVEWSKSNHDFEPRLLSEVQASNLRYRAVEDWKIDKGRAVSEE